MSTEEKIINLMEFLKLTDKDNKTVKKAIDRGDFPVSHFNNRYKIDLNNKAVQGYIKNCGIKTGNKKRATKKIKLSKEAKEQIKYINNTEEDIPDYIKNISDSSELSISDMFKLSRPELEKLKIYEQIKDLKLKTEKKREELISKRLVRTIFSKLYEIDMNEFLTIKEKVIVDIAAIFGSTDPELSLQAGAKLDEQLWKSLDHIKLVMNKFLKKLKEKQIK